MFSWGDRRAFLKRESNEALINFAHLEHFLILSPFYLLSRIVILGKWNCIHDNSHQNRSDVQNSIWTENSLIDIWKSWSTKMPQSLSARGYKEKVAWNFAGTIKADSDGHLHKSLRRTGWLAWLNSTWSLFDWYSFLVTNPAVQGSRREELSWGFVRCAQADGSRWFRPQLQICCENSKENLDIQPCLKVSRSSKDLSESNCPDFWSFPFSLSSTGRRSFTSASAPSQKDAIRHEVSRNRGIYFSDWDPLSANERFQRQNILEQISRFSWIVIQNGENDSYSMLQIRLETNFYNNSCPDEGDVYRDQVSRNNCFKFDSGYLVMPLCRTSSFASRCRMEAIPQTSSLLI
jgi:hypothetical protein